MYSQSGDINWKDRLANKQKNFRKLQTYACTLGWKRDQGTQHTAYKAADPACIMQKADFNLMK